MDGVDFRLGSVFMVAYRAEASGLPYSRFVVADDVPIGHVEGLLELVVLRARNKKSPNPPR